MRKQQDHSAVPKKESEVMGAGRYRMNQRPQRVVDAIQWSGREKDLHAVTELVGSGGTYHQGLGTLDISTRSGQRLMWPGEWVIRDDAGEIWVYSHHIFEEEFTREETKEPQMESNLIDIGPECFTNGDVISYKGENFYRACGVSVTTTTRTDGGDLSCAKRVGHPGLAHETDDGIVFYISHLHCGEATTIEPPLSDGMTPLDGRFSDPSETTNDLVRRRVVWDQAKSLVDGIVAELGIQEYKMSPSILTLASSSTKTKLDQYLDAVESLAEWLLGEA